MIGFLIVAFAVFLLIKSVTSYRQISSPHSRNANTSAIEGGALEPEQIIAFLKQKLAAYKIPRKVLLFSECDLSFTGTQKIQTSKLVAKALTRLRDEGAIIEGVSYGDYLADAAS